MVLGKRANPDNQNGIKDSNFIDFDIEEINQEMEEINKEVELKKQTQLKMANTTMNESQVLNSTYDTVLNNSNNKPFDQANIMDSYKFPLPIVASGPGINA